LVTTFLGDAADAPLLVPEGATFSDEVAALMSSGSLVLGLIS
jgi:hypothetical protein